jgi:hypothetical protein
VAGAGETQLDVSQLQQTVVSQPLNTDVISRVLASAANTDNNNIVVVVVALVSYISVTVITVIISIQPYTGVTVGYLLSSLDRIHWNSRQVA